MRKTAYKGRQKSANSSSKPRFWGRHAVSAALDNPDRIIRKIWATREAAGQMELTATANLSLADGADLGRLVPYDAPHQGIVIEVEPLDGPHLSEILRAELDSERPIIVIDQVTDPHNIGAILRSAAAFDACAIVTQDRHSPPESGALAKAASGALEIIPWVRVVNLARALDEIAEAGFWRIGLDGEARDPLHKLLDGRKVALVLGAEGDGLRSGTIQHCDLMARLPIHGQMESLNVSNAAAIALYAIAVASK